MKFKYFLIFILFPLSVSADTVEIDGIWYNLIAKAQSAEVVANPNRYYVESVKIPEEVEYNGNKYIVNTIGTYAFDWSRVKEVTIPSSIKSMKYGAFYKCNDLTKVYISDLEAWLKIEFEDATSNPMYYGYAQLFLNGEELNKLVIPNNIETIGDNSFIGCSSLTSVIIPNTVKSIGENAFLDCKNLSYIEIPNSVTYMGKGCFFSCENITDIVIPNSVIEIGDYVFSGCTKLSSLKLSTGLTYIPAGAFEHCKSLLSVEIPNNIQSFYTYIDRGAFSDCSNLKKLTLGGGVSYIERKTFSECKQLEEVICLSVTPPKADIDVFYDSMIDYTTLYVPDGSVESYKVEVPWKNFKEILPLSSSGIKTIMVGDEIKDIYAPDGSRRSEIRKGINIVRTKNGNTKKVLIK